VKTDVIAASRTWNGLPLHVTSAPPLYIFIRRRLKPLLFSRSFPSYFAHV